MAPKNAMERRRFLGAAAGFALAGCAGAAAGRGEGAGADGSGEAEVTPGEDLMQEHGVLERVLLVHEEVARRIDAGEAFDPAVTGRAVALVRRFVQDYHEKLEEELVFPRLRKAGREVDLVAVLLEQHARGRQVTDEIARLAGAPGPELALALRSFSRMYRPHAAREDTVLFPAFRGVVGGAAYRELGEAFEEREHRILGERGFENAVGEVGELEAALGIGDLRRFTPA